MLLTLNRQMIAWKDIINSNLFIRGQHSYHTETSHLICNANHLAGFFEMRAMDLHRLTCLQQLYLNQELKSIAI